MLRHPSKIFVQSCTVLNKLEKVSDTVFMSVSIHLLWQRSEKTYDSRGPQISFVQASHEDHVRWFAGYAAVNSERDATTCITIVLTSVPIERRYFVSASDYHLRLFPFSGQTVQLVVLGTWLAECISVVFYRVQCCVTTGYHRDVGNIK